MALSKPHKVLFISHEAYRTGAPIVLLHLLKWLKNNTPLQFDVLLLNDGPLCAEFEALAKTYVVNDIADKYSYTNRLKKKLLNAHIDPIEKVTAKLASNNYDLVYGNTALSLPWLMAFKTTYGLKTICCIHELSYALNHNFSWESLSKNLSLTDKIIAVSGAVKDSLISNYSLTAGKVELQYEFIDTSATANSVPQQLTENKDTYIIGSGGTPEWRKGADLMVPLALKLIAEYPALNFTIAWLGADEENNYGKMIRYDAEKCGITDKLLFIPPSDKPLDVIGQFDVFVVLSREDPFPLIALEAAWLGKPIVAFEGGGGIPELVKQDAGLLAPYLDIDMLSKHLHWLSMDVRLRDKLGAKGKELVLNKYNTGVIAPEIYKIIGQVIATEKSAAK